MGNNGNNPKQGSQIAVEPIKQVKDLKAIKQLLRSKPRDYALFVLGINTNLRASDLLSLTVGQVEGLQPMDELVVQEQKTGKQRRINVNKAAVDAINGLLATMPDAEAEAPLFQGQRGPLTVSYVNRLVKSWCKALNLKGNYGSHSLRKTWGYHQRVTFGKGLPELMVCFNHSSQRQTLDYLCIQAEEIKSVYANEL
ncbi:phage integrase family protein [Desulfobotulus alkaliphilus]|uniref:Phage integrase family protein n=1 Tax=Desulfobotulus alkaliphilus TaxID=622671 RepID=A0A562R9N4_9BACT|nr:site-specific integrase [Desulfobotulus alkaliphilus]TWI65779.1 phage integrase family protein [Desulfobotulus alkaliphilus]